MKLYNVIRTSNGAKVAEIMCDGTLYFVDNAFYAELATPDDLSLDGLKAFYKQQVDEFAGEVRYRYLPRGGGVELTYRYKAIEAQNFKDAGYNGTEADYPFIFKQATATGKTPQEVCDNILARVAALKAKGSTIEAQRERGHKQIDEALDATEAEAAKKWAIDSLNAN